jgi:hypothetical protein
LYCSKQQLKIFRVDCPADSGPAETYTADKCKMAVFSPPAKFNVCVVLVGDKNLLFKGKNVTVRNMGTGNWETVHQALAGNEKKQAEAADCRFSTLNGWIVHFSRENREQYKCCRHI